MQAVTYAMWWWGRAGRRTLGGVYGLLLFLAACDSPPKTVAGVSLAEYDLQQGNQIWSDNCMRCHAMGLAGAPKIGDTAAWAPRLAKVSPVTLGTAFLARLDMKCRLVAGILN